MLYSRALMKKLGVKFAKGKIQKTSFFVPQCFKFMRENLAAANANIPT